MASSRSHLELPGRARAPGTLRVARRVLPAGLFPRELSYAAADNSVLMSNFQSATVQMFSVPAATGP